MLHASTFDYLKPTDEQVSEMAKARAAVRTCAEALDAILPSGADKTYLLRKLREVGMWANVALTRNADGSPIEPINDPDPVGSQLEKEALTSTAA